MKAGHNGVPTSRRTTKGNDMSATARQEPATEYLLGTSIDLARAARPPADLNRGCSR
ncbi:hypothetical protein [Actinomadura madurae]|uniref:hypothetical protein n=1 Tax=Actinomadura madurae TaxID=1993 RepID=UPI0020D256FC|nr:hypothetical protein [Actinomadura madurae]MCQ0018022.1 hypothetical protein [Actinomadura madurae]